MSRLLIKKDGKGKYISNLDLMRTMQRVFIRAGVKIKHTEGFNPHPYISFALPIPLGTESICELMDFELIGNTDINDVPQLLNEKLPEGITVISAYEQNRKFRDIKWLRVCCSLIYDNNTADTVLAEIKELFNRDTLTVSKKTKRGMTELDILPHIKNLTVTKVSESEIVLLADVSAQEPSMSPAWIMSAIEQHKNDIYPDFARFSRLEVFDKDMTVFR